MTWQGPTHHDAAVHEYIEVLYNRRRRHTTNGASPQPKATDSSSHEIFTSAITIERVAARMGRLLGDLLDLACIEAGTFAIVVAEHDAGSAVAEAVESYLPAAAARRISVKGETPGGSIRAHVDHQRIVQVLGNLLTNAIKVSPEAGTVTVSARRRGQDVCFSVSDAGPGIEADRLQSIFERFSHRTRVGRAGLGIGLYIAKGIVLAHGGRMWVESELGRGSTFHFSIPRRLGTESPLHSGVVRSADGPPPQPGA